MTTPIELQQEEIEVLRSIYDGDEKFIEVSDTVYQYKFGEDGNYKSFLLEISWGENYPEEMPSVNMDTFYNKHILDKVKSSMVENVQEQAADLLETAMTYTLFEYVKENVDELMSEQPNAPIQNEDKDSLSGSSNLEQNQVKKLKEKKEQLTKAQKRKQYNKFDATGDYPRGHDWVDIIRHLSQSGQQNS